jgi:hypothetical protein
MPIKSSDRRRKPEQEQAINAGVLSMPGVGQIIDDDGRADWAIGFAQSGGRKRVEVDGAKRESVRLDRDELNSGGH